MTADVLIWTGILAATAAAASVYLYATRDTGNHSAGPHKGLAKPLIATCRNAASSLVTSLAALWAWARETWLIPYPYDASRDHAQPPTPPRPQPYWPAPQLDYQISDNTTWNELRAIGKGGQP